jgi:DNA-binding MarR family transcriptional regulator
MAVNPRTRAGAPSSPTGEPATVEADLHEMVRITRPVMALKSHGEIPTPFQAAFAQAGLGQRHVPALLTVTLEGPLSVTELADELGLSLSTTSLMVGELSRAGLLERSEDEEDRRRTIVRLNERCRPDVDAWIDVRLVPFRRTLEALSPRARAHFLEGWRVLVRELAASAKGEREGC